MLFITIFVFLTFCKIDWYKTLFITTRYYLISNVILCLFVYFFINALKHIKKLGNISEKRIRYIWIYFFIFILQIYYVIITAYANKVYPILPSNRGGRLPLHQVCITLNNYDTAKTLYKNIQKEKKGRKENIIYKNKIHIHKKTIYPLYIIEQTDTCIYISANYPAFIDYSIFEKFPRIHRINKDDIVTIAYNKFDVRKFYSKYLNK